MSARHQQRIVTDEDVEKALSWLRDSAKQMGHAKARMIRAGHMVKHIEALETKMSSERSVEAKKADARCSKRYLDAIEADALATGAYQELLSRREANAMTIEAWRSEAANYRAMRI